MTATTRSKWTVLGKSDEVTTCECCGKSNLKATVVMTDGEQDVRYGRDCAAQSLLGNNKAGSVKVVEAVATAIDYARKWLKHTPKHTAAVVANAIRVRWTGCSETGEYAIQFPNGVTIAA